MGSQKVRWIPASLGMALAVLWVALSGACLQASGLGGITITQDGGNGGDGAVPCTSASQCNDSNPCTSDTCGPEGFCAFIAIPDGVAPAADQMAGTCQQIVCTGGVASNVADDTNVPVAPDMCTAESCVAGVPTSAMQPDGTQCALGTSTGVCKSGTCTVACTTASDCTTNNACQTPSCNGATGTCVLTNVADGTPTPGVTPVMGTCHAHICLGGVDTDQVDDSNVPAIPAGMAGCADAVCTSGTPSNPLHAVDSGCSTYMTSMPGFCNAAGNCAQCTQDSECPGTINDCQHPTCAAATGACTTTNTPAGTATTVNPAQTAGDCQTIECDGNGGTMSVADNMDVPTYGNDCQTGHCTNGVPSTSVNTGMTCPTPTSTGGFVCNNEGQCGCATNADCSAPETCGGGGTPKTCGCTPLTTAACMAGTPKVTCGSIPDGCFGTVNCNDGVKDGNETGTDCGGGTTAQFTCTTLCAQGIGCKANADCTSGLTCVGGVCCNSACGASCEACTNAQTGLANGVCGAVKSGGADPAGVCTSSAASTCGDDGAVCNGAGACMLWPNGTICAPSSCSGTTLTKAETCTNGTCSSLMTQNCAPYKCGGNPAACTTTCNVDTDCATPATDYCNPSHQCVARLNNGTACTPSVEATQCVSSNCVTGVAGGNTISVCCNSACTGTACESCLGLLTGGANGTCAPITVAGTPDPNGKCAVSTPASSCGTDGNCTATATCEKYGSSTSCGTAVCALGVETGTGTCNGSGACTNMSTMNCAPYICGATTCKTSCASDSDCATPATDYCSASQCVPRLANGATCSATAENSQCLSSNCATASGSSVCCNSACNGKCQSCLAALNGGTTGTCGNIDVAGTPDPSGTCVDQGATNPCGTDGKCTASATCEDYGAGTPCTGTATCSGGGITMTPTECNGSGMCNQNPTMGTCSGNYGCNGSSCRTTCSSSGQCATNYTCNTGTCALIPTGSSGCSSSAQCTGGFSCFGGVCCNATCNLGAPCGATSCALGTGACQGPSGTTVCTTGTCSGGDSIAGLTVCNGVGNCVSAGSPLTCSMAGSCMNGAGASGCATCATNADCPYGYCSSGTCEAKLVQGSACTVNSECLSNVCTGTTCQ
jgi:hypothetical protein